MDRNPFKTFIKFRKLENSYEDDCKIYYPTEWDREYLAYRRYCQNRMREIALSAYNEDFVHHEELQRYLDNFPLYAVRSFFCRYHRHETSESYEHLGFVPFNSSDVITIYDNTTGDFESEHCECSESQHEGLGIDMIENDSDVRFNMSEVDYGTANYVECDEYDNYCQYCKRRRRYEDAQKAPSILNLGVFLSNLETKPKVLKRRKVKQFHSRKFEHVSSNSCTSIISIVNSDINIEEIITVEDCDCKDTPTEDTRTFKMTYSKAIHCKSSKFRSIEKTPSDETNNQIDMIDTKHRMQYSQIVSGNVPKAKNSKQSDALTIDFFPQLKVIKETKSNETVNLRTTQIDQTATKDVKACRTYSEAVHSNLEKSSLRKPRSFNKKVGLPKIDIENTFDQVATKEKTYKTSYSQAVYHNLPKSTEKSTTDVTTCSTYSKITYCSVSKSRIVKKTSSNKEVGFNASPIVNAFDQPPSDVKTSRTFSQAVSCGVPKLGNDFDQTPKKNIIKTTTKKIKPKKTKPNQVKVKENIKTTTKKIKPKKTKPNQVKVNKISKKEISQAVGNNLPETALVDRKTSLQNIPVAQLWSRIVSQVPEKTMTHEVDSITEGNNSPKLNTVTFSKDTIEIEINPNIPISSTFRIVSGEIHAITSVHDKISESKCTQDLEIEKIIPNCDKTSKSKKDSNSKTQPRLAKEAKLKLKKNLRFVKLETRNTSPFSEKTVEKPAELEQIHSWFSYSEIINSRKTEALPVSPPTSQPIDDSNLSNKEKWIMKKSKHKRLNRNKKM